MLRPGFGEIFDSPLICYKFDQIYFFIKFIFDDWFDEYERSWTPFRQIVILLSIVMSSEVQPNTDVLSFEVQS